MQSKSQNVNKNVQLDKEFFYLKIKTPVMGTGDITKTTSRGGYIMHTNSPFVKPNYKVPSFFFRLFSAKNLLT